MDVKKIESLAKLMQETGLTALELTEGESVLKLERKQEVIAAAPVAVAGSSFPAGDRPDPAGGHYGAFSHCGRVLCFSLS